MTKIVIVATCLLFARCVLSQRINGLVELDEDNWRLMLEGEWMVELWVWVWLRHGFRLRWSLRGKSPLSRSFAFCSAHGFLAGCKSPECMLSAITSISLPPVSRSHLTWAALRGATVDQREHSPRLEMLTATTTADGEGNWMRQNRLNCFYRSWFAADWKAQFSPVQCCFTDKICIGVFPGNRYVGLSSSYETGSVLWLFLQGRNQLAYLSSHLCK